MANYPRSCIHNELPAHTDEGSSKMVVDLENVKTMLKMVKLFHDLTELQ